MKEYGEDKEKRGIHADRNLNCHGTTVHIADVSFQVLLLFPQWARHF